MSIVFEKSNTKAAFHSLIEAMIPLLVGGTLGAMFILNPGSSTFFKIVGIFALCLSAPLTLRTLRETKTYLNNKQGWRVEIANGVLTWSSPAPEILKPFKINLSDIKEVREESVDNIGSENSPDVSYYIDMRNGNNIQVNYSFASIYPDKVFSALSRQGIRYKKVLTRRYNRRRTETVEKYVE